MKDDRKNRLEDLRNDKDLTQKQVAEIFFLQPNQYRRYEKGESPLPLEWAVKFADFYDVSLDYIACLIPEPRKLKEPITTKTPTLKKEEKELIREYKQNPKFREIIKNLMELIK